MFKQVIAWIFGVALIFGGFMVVDTYQRDHDPCEQTKVRFEQAIHYVGRSHVVTTINGVPGNTPDTDYYTRGYSGPTTAAERSAESEALASWKSLDCKGAINPNSEFWQ